MPLGEWARNIQIQTMAHPSKYLRQANNIARRKLYGISKRRSYRDPYTDVRVTAPLSGADISVTKLLHGHLHHQWTFVISSLNIALSVELYFKLIHFGVGFAKICILHVHFEGHGLNMRCASATV